MGKAYNQDFGGMQPFLYFRRNKEQKETRMGTNRGRGHMESKQEKNIRFVYCTVVAKKNEYFIYKPPTVQFLFWDAV